MLYFVVEEEQLLMDLSDVFICYYKPYALQVISSV